jgi:histone deacetylase complex subunit SAP130
MPNENDKSPIPQNKPTIHAQLPIDLASKVIVKPANDSKMLQQPTFRTIQQPAQMRVVRMPTPSGTQIIQTQLVPQTILKTPMQQTGRSTITVSKSPATYLPRVTATLSTIPQNKAGQQIRTPTPPVSATTMSPAFVRSITPRTSSPTAVLSQGGTAWVSGGNAMQVQVPTQLIRSTITQNRTHILQPSSVTVTNNAGNAQTITNIFGQQSQQQNLGGSTTISVTTSGGSGQTQQPTYVATVLPQRPQAATIVYTSQQQQPFTAIQGQVQRMGIGNPSANTRQVRPIQRIPTTGIRVNTSSLSIRPNVPGLTPTTVLTTQNRGTSGLVAGTSTTISNTIPARIFQVQTSQTQSVTGSQQVLGQQNQKILQANVMTLPIIVNNRINPQVKNTLQPGIIAHVSKLQPGSVSSDGTIISNSITTTIPSNTMVASIQAGQQNQNQSNQLQVSQGSSQGSYSTAQQVGNLSNQGGNQIITVSQQQQQQIIQGGQQNLHQQGSNVSTVVPLQISARSGNIPIKTITVSTANTGLDASSLHRNLSSNAGNMQATTIMPIAKLVQSQQQQNHGQNSNQPTSVFIQTRIPSTMSTTNSNQVVNVSTPSSTIFSSAGTTVYYEPASMSIAPSSSTSHGNIEAKSTSISTPTNESSSFTVVSAPNIRYTDKMIQSIIANSYSQANSANSLQQQSSVSASQPHQQTVRYSPLVVESQNTQSQNQQHQIITMTSGNIIQQAASQQQQQQNQQNQQIQNTSIESSVITALPASPRSTISAIRKQNETTPIKIPKKAAKPTSSTKQESKQIPVAATSSSPKGLVISERESSPVHVEHDWSDDGSTTVSIPNSPSPEEDDLDAMIMSNQFNRKSQDETDLSKFIKTVAKLGSAVKRELSDPAVTPKKKQKISIERPSTDVVDKAGPPEPAESTENIVVKKRDVILKKPTVMLLNAYNQNWKPAPNHFVRYSDVRVRGDDRRANVMDLANQPKVSQRINGWKTHLINAEIDEVINDETREMEILTNVLKRLEAKESGPEAEKINELIKGNMQRSRLIVDSFNDSKAQLMKIFEHKEHALDIVNRCVSKRNFKKR